MRPTRYEWDNFYPGIIYVIPAEWVDRMLYNLDLALLCLRRTFILGLRRSCSLLVALGIPAAHGSRTTVTSTDGGLLSTNCIKDYSYRLDVRNSIDIFIFEVTLAQTSVPGCTRCGVLPVHIDLVFRANFQAHMSESIHTPAPSIERKQQEM